ncbi:MAG: hypothetical protein IJH04_00510 [Eggerthellaceae bacterium]|nr:hypothetical protein [Eggerthellaceae bacterium]
MKRKDYERPTMRVVEIQQRGMLMVSGDPVRGGNSINNWGDGGTTDEDIYM